MELLVMLLLASTVLQWIAIRAVMEGIRSLRAEMEAGQPTGPPAATPADDTLAVWTVELKRGRRELVRAAAEVDVIREILRRGYTHDQILGIWPAGQVGRGPR